MVTQSLTRAAALFLCPPLGDAARRRELAVTERHSFALAEKVASLKLAGPLALVIVALLADFGADPPDPARIDAANISLACALGYLDWRRQSDWRADRPELADCPAAFAAAQPAFAATERPQ